MLNQAVVIEPEMAQANPSSAPRQRRGDHSNKAQNDDAESPGRRGKSDPTGQTQDGEAPISLGSRTKDVAGAIFHAAAPYWINWAVTVGLIFGGCCSNVGIKL